MAKNTTISPQQKALDWYKKYLGNKGLTAQHIEDMTRFRNLMVI